MNEYIYSILNCPSISILKWKRFNILRMVMYHRKDLGCKSFGCSDNLPSNDFKNLCKCDDKENVLKKHNTKSCVNYHSDKACTIRWSACTAYSPFPHLYEKCSHSFCVNGETCRPLLQCMYSIFPFIYLLRTLRTY